MLERSSFPDERERKGPDALFDRRVLDLHATVAPGRSDVDQRGEFDAALPPVPGIVVCPPEVGLVAALLQEHLLGVSVLFAAEGHHTTPALHHVLYQVTQEPMNAD